MYTVATVAPILTVLAITPIVTHQLGAEQYGQVAVAVSIYQVGSVLLAYGLPAMITRDALLDEGGFPGACGYVVMGAVLALVGFAVVCGAAWLWAPSVYPGVPVLVVIYAAAAGAGLAIVTLSQALMRAAERVVVFVLIAACAALLPPSLGLAVIAIGHGSAAGYSAGLAAGYLISGAIAVVVAVRFVRPVINRMALVRALRAGIPTVPHGLAVPALLTVVIALVVRSEGLGIAGGLQIAVLLGTSVVTVLNAINNAWAPMIFRASADQRPRVLAESTFVVATLTLILVAGFVAAAPVLVPLIGGPALSGPDAIGAAYIVAGSGCFAVLYLANIHLTFIERRTWPLAILTPLAAILSVGMAWLLASFSDLPLLAWATAWPLFYLLQAVSSYLLAVFGSANPVRVARTVPLTVLSLGVVAGAGPWVGQHWWLPSVIGLVAVVIGGIWVLVVRAYRPVQANPSPAAGTRAQG